MTEWTDTDLANACVALGVGGYWDDTERRYRLGITDKLSVDAYAFVRDWRVAGAMLNLVYDAYATIEEVIRSWDGGDPRAIIEATVEALT